MLGCQGLKTVGRYLNVDVGWATRIAGGEVAFKQPYFIR